MFSLPLPWGPYRALPRVTTTSMGAGRPSYGTLPVPSLSVPVHGGNYVLAVYHGGVN